MTRGRKTYEKAHFLLLILFTLLPTLSMQTGTATLFSEYKAVYQLRWYGLKVGKSNHTVRKIAGQSI